MTFDHPLWLLLLPLLAAPWLARRSRVPLAPPPGFAPRRSPLRAFPPRLVSSLAIAATVAALAGPRLAGGERTVRSQGVDLLLLVDTSASMTRRDLDPERSRLEVALERARDFVAGRPGDRIGLLTFAKYPRLRCPLTLDHGAVTEILSRVESVAGREEERSTAIGVALAAAVLSLRDSPAKSRIVVLVTDGQEEEHAIEPMEAARFAAEEGVRVYAIALARSRGLWSRQLVTLARRTGGEGYSAFRADALRRAFARIDSLERSTIERREVVPGRPLHPELLLAGAASLLLLPILRRIGWGRLP